MDFDVAIVGMGPAGLQAAIHASRAKVSVALVGRLSDSAISKAEIENVIGFADRISGLDLISNGKLQAESFGAKTFDLDVVRAEPSEGDFRLYLEDGRTISAKAIILATGISRVNLGVPGEKEFGNGKGVSYCASCDSNFYKGRPVAVVGGKSEAAMSAELMTKYASKTYWVSDVFEADDTLIAKADAAGAERIKASVKEIKGDGKVSSVLLSNGREIGVEGVFIELGAHSSVDLAMELGVMPELDDTIKVGRDCSTEIAGVFACGDITGRPWQAAKAIGEGAVAGISAASYVKKVGKG